jgi:hypothetical protein
MDFTTHNSQHANTPSGRPFPVTPETPAGSTSKTTSSRKRFPEGKGWRIGFVVLLFSTTLLLASVILLIAYGNRGDEIKLVNSSDIQAVDINIAGSSPTNQLYFGHITSISSNYMVMQDIYYFPASSSTSNSSATTLQPLVCQIDAPISQMMINRSSIVWWENLQNSGQVAKVIAQYEKAHPNGPTCTTTTATTSTPNPASSTTPKP